MFYCKKLSCSLLLGLSLGVGLLAVVTAPQSVFAQADLASVSGIILDSTGAAIGKAAVTITNSATGAVRVSYTNSKGEYSIPQLSAGEYSISVAASGFGTATETLTLTVGSSVNVSLKLSVGSAKTELSVSADDSTSVHLESPEISTVITPEEISSLPLADRDAYGLVSLSGNLTSDPTGGNRGVGFNIAGARSASVDILLDGAENTDVYGVGIGQTVPLDATQEFSVVEASQGAQYGRASGGAVNVSTKSGTNQIHGDAYEYNRISTFASDGYNNNALYAAGDLANPKSRYVHNQFGYFVGGPIVRDKLFFASATEWTRVRSNSTVVSEVPLPGLISLAAADTQAYFAAYGASLAHPVDGQTYTGQDLINEGVFASDIRTAAVANPSILTTPLFGTSAYENPGDSGGGTPQNTWNNFDRIDYTISQKTSMYARYSQLNNLDFDGTNNTSPYAGYNTGSSQKNYNLLVSVTHVFSNTLSASTKLLGTRFNNSQPLGTVPVSPTLYVNGSSSVALGAGTIYFPGYSATSPGNAIPFGGPQNFIQIGEDISWSIGKHNLSFGGEFLNIKDNRVFGAYENAVDALVQSGTKGALTNFLSGQLGEIEVAVNPNGVYPCSRSVTTGGYNVTPSCEITLPASQPNFSRSNRYQDGAVYATDSYKATPRLTFNGGLRWEVYGPQHSQRPSLDANFFLGSGGSIYDNIRSGQVLTRVNSPNGRLWNLNLKQFGPRLGFAYDLSGKATTSLRGGYGISYERNFNNVTFNVIQNPPNYGVVALISKTGTPISTNNLGAFGTGTGSVALPNTTLRAVDPNIKPAYAQNWTLTIEHQLDPNTLVSLGYIGSRGIHNYSIANLNRQFSGVNYLGDNPATGNRLNLQYSNINFRGADGDSYYESLNLGIRSNNLLHSGLGIQANYTYGHSIDNTSSTFTDGGSNDDNLGYLDPFNHGLDRGNSDFDQRHRITSALWWKNPFFAHSNALLKNSLGGWNAATTFSAVTGNPYTIFDCGFAYTVCPRVSFVGSAPKKLGSLQDISSLYGPNTFSSRNLPPYTNPDGSFNSAAYNEFINPLTGTSDTPLPGGASLANGGFVSGMTGRNAFTGPGSWGENFIASKDIAIHDRYSFKLSATFINVFNHANTYLNLSGTNDVSSYPYILAYKGGNRNTELEARFNF